MNHLTKEDLTKSFKYLNTCLRMLQKQAITTKQITGDTMSIT